MFNRISKALTSVTVIAVIGLGSALAQTPAKQKQVKDQAEFDLFNQSSPQTATDPTKRLGALTTWKEKYPETDYNLERAIFFAVTYQQLNQPAKMFEAAKEVLAIDPKEINALGWVTALTETLPPTPDTLSAGEKAAQGLLGASQPQGVAEAQWKTMRTAYDTLAHRVLGFVATQRKQHPVAEQEYMKTLEVDPTQALASYGVGSAILAQQKPERYSEALFHLARAASLSGPNALPPAMKTKVDAFLIKSYTTYHGQDEAGLKELRQLAVGPKPAPPEGFKIKDVNQIAEEKAAQLAKENPELATWKTIKEGLLAPNGEQYWESGFKGTDAPKFYGFVVSMTPPTRPKELVLAIETPEKGEVTLKFETALAGKADPGTKLWFIGVPSTFTKEPFMVTFDVDNDKIEGWPVQAPPAKKVVPGVKKSSKKGK